MRLSAKRITTFARSHGGYKCCTYAVRAGMHFWFILQLKHGVSKLASEIFKADELKGHVVQVFSLIPGWQHKELGIIIKTQLSVSSHSLPRLTRHKDFLVNEGEIDSYPCTLTYCSLEKILVLQIACQRKSWKITKGYDTVRTGRGCHTVGPVLQGCSLCLALLEEH